MANCNLPKFLTEQGSLQQALNFSWATPNEITVYDASHVRNKQYK